MPRVMWENLTQVKCGKCNKSGQIYHQIADPSQFTHFVEVELAP